jgi:FixJ family two-component response regulator
LPAGSRESVAYWDCVSNFLQAAKNRDWAAVVVQVGSDDERRAALRLPASMWQQGSVAPVVFVLDGLRPRWLEAAWRAGAADVLSRAATGRRILLRALAAAERWRPLRQAAAELRRFESCQSRLTRREQEILERMIAGQWLKRIAAELGTSLHTVRKQRASLYAKLDVQCEAELLRLALSARWLQTIAAVRGWTRQG